MKKQLQKLRLSKETLRNLSEDQMEGAVGGVTTLCSGTSSGPGCTGTLWSDCHCGSQACSANC